GVVEGAAVHRLDENLRRGAGAFGDLRRAELEVVAHLFAHVLVVGADGAGHFHRFRHDVRAAAAVDVAYGDHGGRQREVGLAADHGLHAVDHLGGGDDGVDGVPGHAAVALAAGDADVQHVAGGGGGPGAPAELPGRSRHHVQGEEGVGLEILEQAFLKHLLGAPAGDRKGG